MNADELQLRDRVLNDDSILHRGNKHCDKKMQDVPAEYLDWLDGQLWFQNGWPEVYAYVRKRRKAIDQELDTIEFSRLEREFWESETP